MSNQRTRNRSSNNTPVDGHFSNLHEAKEKNYRTCIVHGHEVKVWGAQSGCRGLEQALVVALKGILARFEPDFPIALMADHHPAEMGVVGSVVASSTLVVPDCIGADVGCGVSASCLGLKPQLLERELLQTLFAQIVEAIPCGTKQQQSADLAAERAEFWQEIEKLSFVGRAQFRKLKYQLGTLGGGNHFIELARDEHDQHWLLVHTGSRYLGGLLQRVYHKRNLPLHSAESEKFFQAQEKVLTFARMSRRHIADKIVEVFEQNLKEPIDVTERIDVPHNFVTFDSQCGVPVAVHRKGACHAPSGTFAIVPGSMGTGSFLVQGRGNIDSYSSISHGAGRVLSRGEAFRTLSTKDLFRDMASIVWAEDDSLKDEAPRAYKNLTDVIRAQRDLLKVHRRLQPVLVVKGGRR